MRRDIGVVGAVLCCGVVWPGAASYSPAQALPGAGEGTPGVDEQISPYVRRIFQDSRGHFWFGTNGDGVVRYDGSDRGADLGLARRPDGSLRFPARALEHFSIDEGLGGAAVRAIVEDREGDVWFGTSGGVTRYDGESFTNYTEADGLASNDVWCVEIDRAGLIWIGTLEGVSRFDGERFTAFELPESEPDHSRGVTSGRVVHCIMEDSTGRMWFGTNGGAYVHDGRSLSNLSEDDGLCGDAVNCILEDGGGRIWFATHHGGVCRWDGEAFTRFGAREGVEGTEAWDLYEDSAGNVWFPTEGFGVYRFDGESFANYRAEEGLASRAIQCTHEDREGRIWVGGWLGAYVLEGETFVNVARGGARR